MTLRILVIDDDDQIRELIREVLERVGHTVFEADNGDSGIKMVGAETVDVVVTDIIMPDKDGLETITELRKSHPEIKIIAISGGGRRVNRDYLPTAQAFGADRVLYKPFRPQEVVQAVNEVSQIEKQAAG
jgi:CheY-like chemotaxis protein